METVGPSHIPPPGSKGPDGKEDITRSQTLPETLPKSGNAPLARYDQPAELPQMVFIKIQALILAGIFHDRP